MKTSNLILFLSIILSIYTAGNYYIFRRSLQALPENFTIKIAFILLFVLFYASYFGARFLESSIPQSIFTFFIWLGSIWLAALLYFLLFALLFDFSRLVNHFFAIYPHFITENWQRAKLFALIVSIFSVFIILLIGFINNANPSVKYMTLEIPKKNSQLSHLKIALASDIHLGVTITKAKIDKLIELINKENPDIILLAGDILDEDPKFIIQNKLGQPLKYLSAKYGVWAIMGNHEYIGGASKAEEYIKSLGITLLKDSTAIIDNAFNLIGRDDLSANHWNTHKRKDLSLLLEKANPNLPTIMMDHQPFHLEDVAKYPIDLQLSGHTHHGQLFPFNFITSAIYEVSYGYKKINNTNFFVSSGYGLWGPPIRTINRPEIIVININFK
jgi:predicted MPP superfamily phosphohydrolase